MNTTIDLTDASFAQAAPIRTASPSYQAFRILQIGFVAAPILFGVDKFFHVLVNWDQYLPAIVARLSPIGGHNLMLIVGVVEICAGIGVAWKPRIFAYVVAAWLAGIIVNLLLIPGYFDVALRDFGLLLAALTLARLSEQFSRAPNMKLSHAVSSVGGAAAAIIAFTTITMSYHLELTSARFIDRFEQINGVHSGFRRNHAKGLGVSGFFESNGNGVRLSKAAVFEPGRVPVIGRFSLDGGQPYQPDRPNTRRGLGLQFSLPNGELWRTAMISFPLFPVRTPEIFYERLLAFKQDPATGKPDPAQVKAFEERHPETVEVLKKITAEPQASGFGNTTFHGLNAFLFTNAAGKTTPVRWILKPMQPFEAAGAAPPDKNYLFDELITQIHRQSLRWRLIVIAGKPGDPTNDPSIGWPADREQVDVGTLTLDRVEAEELSAATDIVFDPLMLPAGIAPSDDPVLRVRSGVYVQSHTRRAGETKQPSAITPADVMKGEKTNGTTKRILLTRRSPAYWRVTFDHPPLNIFGPEMIPQLNEIITALEKDEQVKVVVFDSAVDGFFLTHYDFLARPEDTTSLPPGPSGLGPFNDMLVRLSRAPVVSIASIRGRATGNGSELALACDMRFASREKAILSHFEVGAGVVPGGGPMARLPRLMGRGRALEVLLGADDIPGDLAELYGYVNRSLPDSDLDGFVESLATRIASFDKRAISETKRFVDVASLPPDYEIAPEWDVCIASTMRPAAQERIKKLMERGFHKAGVVEDRLGYHVGQVGR